MINEEVKKWPVTLPITAGAVCLINDGDDKCKILEKSQQNLGTSYLEILSTDKPIPVLLSNFVVGGIITRWWTSAKQLKIAILYFTIKKFNTWRVTTLEKLVYSNAI